MEVECRWLVGAQKVVAHERNSCLSDFNDCIISSLNPADDKYDNTVVETGAGARAAYKFLV